MSKSKRFAECKYFDRCAKTDGIVQTLHGASVKGQQIRDIILEMRCLHWDKCRKVKRNDLPF